MSRLRTLSPYLLTALLAGAGALHFLQPQPYDGIIPSFLPHPRFWTYASGLAELACAAAVAAPRTRERGALVTAGLFIAVFRRTCRWRCTRAACRPCWRTHGCRYRFRWCCGRCR